MSRHRPVKFTGQRSRQQIRQQIRQQSTGPTASKRERAELHRGERARQHLQRVRGGKKASRAVKIPKIPLPRLSIAAPLAIAVSLIVGLVFGSPIVAAARSWIAGEPIRLESLSVSGANRLSLAEVGATTALPKGALVGEIEPEAVELELRSHPWISDAAVVRLPASRLLIRITERVARAVVSTAVDERGNASGWRVVSSRGLAFASADERDVETLPRLVAGSNLSTSASDEIEEFAVAIELTQRFADFELPIPMEVVVDDGSGSEGWVVVLPTLTPRVILGRENLDDRLTALVEILDAGPAELADAASIDLRFAKQAVLRSALPSKGAAQAATTHGRVASPKPRPTG